MTHTYKNNSSTLPLTGVIDTHTDGTASVYYVFSNGSRVYKGDYKTAAQAEAHFSSRANWTIAD